VIVSLVAVLILKVMTGIVKGKEGREGLIGA
jgi:hypothetical protein